MEREYEAEYAKLNDKQRLAVDTIEGPLLVVAGPGTGKTQLLSLRVANILRQTDANPDNILCLTFTESAQANMQTRLGRLIGPQANHVAVYTFHGFGSHIIGSHGDYFQEAFSFRPSDDVTRYELLADILERLPRDDRLSSLYEGQFYYLKDIQSRISLLKQAGLTPIAFSQRVAADEAWLKLATPVLQTELLDVSRISPKLLPKFNNLLTQLNELAVNATNNSIGTVCNQELATALEASGDKDTKPLTAWKNRWLSKNGAGQFVFVATRQLSKLAELATIYQKYQTGLASRRLYDYDDMIVRLIDGLQQSADLRAELQEQYQYILVDEYQDTNGAQLQLLQLLADNPISEGRPNLMVVGDDDQAVYSFQGAKASSMLEFIEHYPAAKTIVLNTNYRSTQPILDLARSLILQGEDRLESKHPAISKQLLAYNTATAAKPKLEILPSQVEQFGWLAKQVKVMIDNGQDPKQIAIIAPKHKHLEQLVPYFQDLAIAVAYERRENVLQQPHIEQLLTLARVLSQLASGEIKLANQSLPELLSYPWWGISAGWLWEIALAASQSKQTWLELLLASPRPALKNIANWLLEQAKACQTTPLEPMLDILIGPAELSRHFASPYRNYYFGHDPTEASTNYLRLLSGLISLRTALRQYRPDEALKLADFIAFADLRNEAKLPLRNDHPLVLDTSAIQLLTAHKAKGLEFEQVFLINSDDQTWHKDRGRPNKIGLPPNYAALAPASDNIDEKLRLLYVATTRAKHNLTLLSSVASNEGRPNMPLGWLQPTDVSSRLQAVGPEKHQLASQQELTRQLSFDWLTPHFILRTKAPWRALLTDSLEHYQLSATHLTAFLNVERGGPKAFLVNQLLHFPQAMSVDAQFGNVLHKLLQRLHEYVNRHAKLPAIKLATDWLDELIGDYYFGPIETPKARRRGLNSLEAIYQQLGSSFHKGQLTEYPFAGEGVVVGQARLAGNIDLIEKAEAAKQVTIIDYKSGSAFSKWPTQSAKTNSYEAYKAHRYRQQLLFYKLLVENSRGFKGYQAAAAAIVFVEPDEDGQLQRVDLNYDAAELERFTRLVEIVYRRIIDLDLPDTSDYTADFQGTLKFEADLLGE